MATWKQILTEATSIGKLSDVNIGTVANGDLLIGTAAAGGSWSNVQLTTDDDNVKVTVLAGDIDIGLETNVTVAGILTSTGDLVVNGGAVTLNAGAVGEDSTLLIKGGSSDKAAILQLQADAGAEALDKWELKAANGGVLTLDNVAGSEASMMKITPSATETASLVELSGDLYASGDTFKLGGDTTFVYDSNKLTITEGTVEVSDAFVSMVSILSPTIRGSVDMRTPLLMSNTGNSAITIANNGECTVAEDATFSKSIEVATIDYTDGDLAMTIANGGKVTTSGDLEVGTSLQTATIDYTDGDLALTIANGGGVTTANTLNVGTDLTVTGNTVTFGNGAIIENDSSSLLTITETTVKIAGNLQVDGTQTIINTETLTVDDNAIVLNDNWAADTAPTQDCGITAYRGTGSGSGVAQSLFFKETVPSDDSTTGGAKTQKESDRWALGATENISKQFDVFNGYIVTVNVPNTGANPTDAENDGSGIGSFWVNHATDAVYIRTR